MVKVFLEYINLEVVSLYCGFGGNKLGLFGRWLVIV